MDEPQVYHHDSPSNNVGAEIPSAEKQDTRSSIPTANGSQSLTATKRPAWLDMLYVVVVGTGMFVVTLKTVAGMLLGVTVLAAVGGCTFAAERRFGSRPPEMPEGSESKDFVRSLAFLAAAIAGGWYIFDHSPEWDLWERAIACAGVAILASAFFLLEAASQRRRLATATRESASLPLPESRL